MRYLAAYLLLLQAGVESPSAAEIEKVLSAVGAPVDSERVAKLISELEGKNIEELIAQGKEKLSAVPAGGAAPVAGGSAAAGGEAAAEKEEEKEDEESDDDMGFGLFD